MSETLQEIAVLFETRHKILRDMRRSLSVGDSFKILEVMSDNVMDLCEIDERLSALKKEDPQAFISYTKRKEQKSEDPLEKLQEIEEALDELGLVIPIELKDRDRVESILNPTGYRSSEGMARGMVKNTRSLGKIFNRGFLLWEEGRPDLAHVFFDYLCQKLDLETLTSSQWVGDTKIVSKDNPFELTESEKAKAYTSLMAETSVVVQNLLSGADTQVFTTYKLSSMLVSHVGIDPHKILT